MLTLASLPVDILILILENLGIHQFAALSQTCHALYVIVSEYGWSTYIRSNPRPSYSLSNARAAWTPRVRATYDYMTDSAWTRPEFIARPLSRVWTTKLQPVLAISPTRLIVGAGSNLYSYKFGTSTSSSTAPPVMFEGAVSLLDKPERSRNITAITFIEDEGQDQTLDVGFHDGAIERVHLAITPLGPDEPHIMSFSRSKITPMPNGDFVESLSSVSDVVLALSSNGHARLSSVHSIDSLSFSRPTAILHTKKASGLPFDKLPSSAVYGLSRGPLNSPWGASPQIIVSGWFDGQVRCYDLRSSSRESPSNSDSGSNLSPLRPVLSLADRWSYEPIYSVLFWDIRSPSTGWSVHAPGNDPSPVYSVILESSRFFGVTQSRPFIYDFGPGVSLDTYPQIPHVRGIDNLKQKKGSNRATYHVLRYAHNSSGLCNEH
ncbi:hypothetical protein CPB84DRAFT_1774963 [Gymnopilus junonius]|uniref:F-box domain-containing protein n=1 Tax=Gymnopilus junonius TaxID=109634 RepID=A0A9P5NRT7_GYMJU|nr:hypothetical protein CPB84DRAFT_1774963 [Gymnopilus junonius]